jgi:hypothetical protein
MKYLIFFSLTFCSASSISAQENTSQDSIAVTKVIKDMFTAMKTSDTNLLKTCFSSNAVFQTIVTKNGVTEVKNELVQDFINSIGKQVPGSLDERITIGSLLIDTTLASVWTPYQFYFKGQYSHQGVNSFQLVRGNNGWKIQYLIDTRRK